MLEADVVALPNLPRLDKMFPVQGHANNSPPFEHSPCTSSVFGDFPVKWCRIVPGQTRPFSGLYHQTPRHCFPYLSRSYHVEPCRGAIAPRIVGVEYFSR